jgi:hypothetical protein
MKYIKRLFFLTLFLLLFDIICAASSKRKDMNKGLLAKNLSSMVSEVFYGYLHENMRPITPRVIFSQGYLTEELASILVNGYVDCQTTLEKKQILSSSDNIVIVENYIEELSKIRTDSIKNYQNYKDFIDPKINLVNTLEAIMPYPTVFAETIDYVVFNTLYDSQGSINFSFLGDTYIDYKATKDRLKIIAEEIEKLKVYYIEDRGTEEVFFGDIIEWFVGRKYNHRLKDKGFFSSTQTYEQECLEKIFYNLFILFDDVSLMKIDNVPGALYLSKKIIDTIKQNAFGKSRQQVYNIFLNVVEKNIEIVSYLMSKALLWVDFITSFKETLKKNDSPVSKNINIFNNTNLEDKNILFKNIVQPTLLRTAKPVFNTLELGHNHHALIAGPSSSGKTTILNAINQNALLAKYFGFTIGEMNFIPPDVVVDFQGMVTALQKISFSRGAQQGLSKGKSERIALAILLNVIKTNSSKRFLITMDEPFTGLPTFTLQNIIKNDFGQLLSFANVNVFFNTHLPSLKQFVDNSYDLLKIKRFYADCKEVSLGNFVATFKINDTSDDAWYIDSEDFSYMNNELNNHEQDQNGNKKIKNKDKLKRYDDFLTNVESKEIYKEAGIYEKLIYDIFFAPFLGKK